MKKFFALAFVVFLCGACAIPFQGGPGKEEMDKADFGPSPVGFETLMREWLRNNLKDYDSAKIEGFTEPMKSWWGNTGALLVPREINFSWMVSVRINAKNAFGAYVGWKVYQFHFRDGKIQHVFYTE